MSAQIEETIEVLREVIQIVTSTLKKEDGMRISPSVRDMRNEAVKRVANKRGIKKQTVHDKLTRKIGLYIDEFDKLLFDYIIGNNHRLKSIFYSLLKMKKIKELLIDLSKEVDRRRRTTAIERAVLLFCSSPASNARAVFLIL